MRRFPKELRFVYRSSTNNEDLPGFNRAGLYDSKTQHSQETEEGRHRQIAQTGVRQPVELPGLLRAGGFTASTTGRPRWESWSIRTTPTRSPTESP